MRESGLRFSDADERWKWNLSLVGAPLVHFFTFDFIVGLLLLKKKKI